MPLREHLRELRRRLVISIAAIAVGAVVAVGATGAPSTVNVAWWLCPLYVASTRQTPGGSPAASWATQAWLDARTNAVSSL